MELKQNQAFFQGTYANLASYLFFIKKQSILMIFKIEISQFYV